ncbi:MAG: SMC-Scp complex subunit ScpB [Woeseiaceae bacterium]|nr:SMC-Scp complex subunit ScpB [Woeseiaceae bacterium]
MDQQEIKYFIESALLAAGRPLSVDQLKNLFDGRSAPDKSEIRKAIAELNDEYEPRGIMIAEVASGFRMQVKAAMADRLQKLWEERPPRYSRALFETLALVAYRQPITRGEIEEVRGVSVSPNIVRTLMERDWVRVVGHRDVPGRPAMFGTTKSFLDYFGLKKLDDLPPLADLQDWESLRVQLNLPDVDGAVEGTPDPGVPAPIPESANGEAEEGVPAVATEGDEASDDVPVLVPEVDEAEEVDSFADTHVPLVVADAEAVDAAETEAPVAAQEAAEEVEVELDIDESDGSMTDELVVSEWPDPAESGG